MAGCECCDNFSMIDGGDEFKAFPGLKGEDGTTYYPHVSSDGIISWTNDGGKPNPDPVNIKGADGKSAYQAAVEAGFSGTEAEFNEYLSDIGVLADEVADQKSAIEDLQDLTNRKAGMLVDTASGAIASIVPDSTIDNLLGLSVDIEPVQAGSGDPSPDNVRPISGWDAVGIEADGENLFALLAENTNNIVTGIDTQTGVVSIADHSTATWTPTPFGYTDVAKGQTYTFSATLAYGRIGGSKSANTFPTSGYLPNTSIGSDIASVATNVVSTRTFTANESIRIYWFYCTDNGIASHQAFTMTPAVNRGSQATAFRPFAGNTYSIQLGQTVYGGTLDVTAGTLTVNRAMVDMGGLSWGKEQSGAVRFYTDSVSGAKGIASADVGNLVCSCFMADSSNNTFAHVHDNAISINGSGAYIYVYSSLYSTAADFKTAVTGQTLVYELATPITITIDPVTISTISGQTNNVWADAGDVSVEFAADIKHYIDSKIAAAVAALS